MKRITLVVACLVLVLLSSTALAYSYDCPCCEGDEPIRCANTRLKYGSGYWYLDETYHVYYETQEAYCRNCGEYVGTGADVCYDVEQLHSFSNNICTKCGYNRSTGKVESVAKDYSYENSLQEDAYQMRDRLIGSIATVVNEGNIRQRPDKESERLGKAIVGDIYTILDYQVALSSRTSVWLKVQYGHAYGWLSASLVEISENDGSTPGGIVGSQVSITLTLGRTRRGAGTSYPKTGYVRQGEVYTVLDSKAASDGVLWYKIEKNGQYHWISSGITEKIR